MIFPAASTELHLFKVERLSRGAHIVKQIPIALISGSAIIASPARGIHTPPPS
ncbi:MAG: hypothetical protein J6T03_05550 [Bacteroidales bacterium]|nr:hypothetical protein [Bacteroidales bacterium]